MEFTPDDFDTAAAADLPQGLEHFEGAAQRDEHFAAQYDEWFEYLVWVRQPGSAGFGAKLRRGRLAAVGYAWCSAQRRASPGLVQAAFLLALVPVPCRCPLGGALLLGCAFGALASHGAGELVLPRSCASQGGRARILSPIQAAVEASVLSICMANCARIRPEPCHRPA